MTNSWTYFAQASIASDMDGDSEIQFTWGAAVTTSDVGASLTGNMTFTSAPEVENLHGMGYQIGGSCLASGLDFVIIPDTEKQTAYGGISFSGGMAIGDGGEFHVSMGNTYPVVAFEFNMLEFFDAVYKSYWGIY